MNICVFNFVNCPRPQLVYKHMTIIIIGFAFEFNSNVCHCEYIIGIGTLKKKKKHNSNKGVAIEHIFHCGSIRIIKNQL